MTSVYPKTATFVLFLMALIIVYWIRIFVWHFNINNFFSQKSFINPFSHRRKMNLCLNIKKEQLRSWKTVLEREGWPDNYALLMTIPRDWHPELSIISMTRISGFSNFIRENLYHEKSWARPVVELVRIRIQERGLTAYVHLWLWERFKSSLKKIFLKSINAKLKQRAKNS